VYVNRERLKNHLDRKPMFTRCTWTRGCGWGTRTTERRSGSRDYVYSDVVHLFNIFGYMAGFPSYLKDVHATLATFATYPLVPHFTPSQASQGSHSIKTQRPTQGLHVQWHIRRRARFCLVQLALFKIGQLDGHTAAVVIQGTRISETFCSLESLGG
jgi:hypothetical protein